MDKVTFGKLVLESEVQLYRIAKAILQRDEDCADAAQEAVTRAFENLGALKNDAYAKTWLIRILINECYRLAKRRAREMSVPEVRYTAGVEDRDYSGLYAALSALEPEFRVVLELHYMEGFQIQEIAGILKVAEGTVKSRMHRGREKMKKLLSEEGL